jgi:16S rRNA processing protein RimM
MNNYFKIGRLVATFGLDGQLTLVHHLGKKTSLKGLENIFIEESTDSFIPYFITATKIKNENEIYLQLEGITSKETAAKFIRKEVWLTREDFKKFSSANAPVSLLGLMIVHNDKPIGEVVEVIEQPHQVLCRILLNGKDAFIPIHEHTLEKIDKKNGTLYVNLPDGLLDVYK